MEVLVAWADVLSQHLAEELGHQS